MLYEFEEKKYYRFPSKNNFIDFVDYGPVYFPSKSFVSNEETNKMISPETLAMKGEL